MDTAKNIFLTIGCVAFALLVAFCVLLSVPSTRTGIYRMLNVASIGEQSQIADEKTELYIQTQTYRVQLESLTSEKNRIQAQLERLQENYDEGVAMLADYQAEIISLNQDLADANNDNNNLQNQIVGLNVSIQNLNNQIDNYISEIDYLNNDLNDLNDQYDSLCSQLEFVTQQKEELISQNTILSNEVTRLNNDIVGLNNSIMELENLVQTQNDRIMSLEDTISILNNDIQDLNEQLWQYQSEPLVITRHDEFNVLCASRVENDLPCWDAANSFDVEDEFVRSGSQIKNEWLSRYALMNENIQHSFELGYNPILQYYVSVVAYAGNYQADEDVLIQERRFEPDYTFSVDGAIDGEVMSIEDFENALVDDCNYLFTVEIANSWNYETGRIANLSVHVRVYTQWQ